MAEFAITGKHITYAVGVCTLIGLGVGGVNYFQSRDDAIEEHREMSQQIQEGDTRIAEYDEVGNLENQIRLTRLEIRQIQLTGERRSLTTDEQSDLDYLKDKILILEDRLLELQAAMKKEG